MMETIDRREIGFEGGQPEQSDLCDGWGCWGLLCGRQLRREMGFRGGQSTSLANRSGWECSMLHVTFYSVNGLLDGQFT